MAQKNDVQVGAVTVLAENMKDGRGTKIRTVEWISGGKRYPQVEKREFFTDEESGELKNGKGKGFNDKDFIVLIKNWPFICDQLHIKHELLEQVFAQAKKGGVAAPAGAQGQTQTNHKPAATTTQEDF